MHIKKRNLGFLGFLGMLGLLGPDCGMSGLQGLFGLFAFFAFFGVVENRGAETWNHLRRQQPREQPTPFQKRRGNR